MPLRVGGGLEPPDRLEQDRGGGSRFAGGSKVESV